MKNPDQPNPHKTLRERAEAMLRTSQADMASMTTQDLHALVHELQVHQMELEIQNEELRHAQMELSESRDRFSDLYEFAPVGYLTLDKQGEVLEANLAACRLLGVERQSIVRHKIADFVAREGQDALHLHRQSVFASPERQICELPMRRVDGAAMVVQLESTRRQVVDGSASIWRVAMIDITARRLAEDELQKANLELDRRVMERTSELMQTIGDLHDEVANRKVFEAKLMRERQFSTNLINTAQAIILVLDLDGRIVMINQFAEDLCGYRLDEIKGRDWIDLMVPPAEQECVRLLLGQSVAGKHVKASLNSITAKDGREIRVEWYDTALHDETGKQIALLAIGQDVTAREKAAQDMRILAKAMANLGEGVLITSDHLNWPGPKIIFVNDAMCRITGYTEAELIGQTPRMLQNDRSDRATLARVRQDLAANKPCLFETINCRKDGSSYHAEVLITPLFNDRGHRTNFVSIHRDISERKRSELLLRASEEKLRAIVNTAADAIITIDQRGIIVSANPASERMLGYNEKELIGHNVNILMHSPFREEHDQYLANYLKTGEAKIIGIGREVVARRKDGTIFPVDLAVSAVDHLGLFTGIIRDISERRKLEQHLAEVRIDEQRRLAQELHDGLGGMMTGISMLASVLQMKLRKAGAEQVEDAAELVQLIRDTHEQLRRLSHGILPVELIRGGLTAALRDLAERSTKDGHLTCDFQCDGDVELASEDHALHLYRIAQEAVSNALRHGHPSRLNIALKAVDNRVTLVVRDNGIGFQQSPDSHGGMGLRTMSYRAKQIGAILKVEPAKGGGTIVSCIYRIA